MNPCRNLVHPCFRYTFFFWNTQIPEYLGAAAVFWLILHAWHDVEEEFRAFAREQRYTHPQHLPANLARLQQAWPRAEAGTVEASQAEAVTLATLLLPVVQMKEAQLRELRRRFAQHPDAPVFDSLPGAGAVDQVRGRPGAVPGCGQCPGQIGRASCRERV